MRSVTKEENLVYNLGSFLIAHGFCQDESCSLVMTRNSLQLSKPLLSGVFKNIDTFDDLLECDLAVIPYRKALAATPVFKANGEPTNLAFELTISS